MFKPTESGSVYPTTDIRHWMQDDERAIYVAASCQDITASLDVSVKLHEYRGKRAPKKLTPEQEERESEASKLLGDYARACDPGVVKALIKRLAHERAAVA